MCPVCGLFIPNEDRAVLKKHERTHTATALRDAYGVKPLEDFS